MRIEAEKKLFTTEDFSKMYEAEILNNDERVELVDGEIIKLNPGRRHAGCTNRATRLFVTTLDHHACVRTLSMDRKRKRAHYARHRVPEYWIADLRHNQVHVYRDPASTEYHTCRTFGRGDSITPIAFPDLSFKVEDLLG
jgi:Uma2 family endonuclease